MREPSVLRSAVFYVENTSPEDTLETIDVVIDILKEEGREEGRHEGRTAERIALARRLLDRGETVETFASLTELSIDDVKRLARV